MNFPSKNLPLLPLLIIIILMGLSGSFTDSLLANPNSKSDPSLKIVFWVGGDSHDFAELTQNLSFGLKKYTNAKIEITQNPDFLLAIPSDRPDVIMMLHDYPDTEGVLNHQQKKHLLQWVHEGTGVVALNSSFQSFHTWKNINELYGAKTVGNLQSPTEIEITIQDSSHPILDDIPRTIQMVSQFYSVKEISKDCQIIATHRNQGTSDALPAIWTRRFGQGRIVTILPGHKPQNYKIDAFQRLIANSIVWTADKEPFAKKKDITDDFIVPDGFKVERLAEGPYLANPLTMTLDDHSNLYISNAHSYRRNWWLAKKQKFPPSNPIVRLTLDHQDQLQDYQIVASGFDNPVLGMALKGNEFYYTNLNKLVLTQVDQLGRVCDENKILIRDQAEPWNPFGMYRLKFGMDDLLYMNIGDHAIKLSNANEKIRTRNDKGGSGISLRFNKDGKNLDLINQGMRAPFTMDFDPFGRLWVISNGEPRCNVLINPVKGADYRFRKARKRDFQALTGKHPLAPPVWETPLGAHTSVIPYYSNALPERYWGKLFLVNWGRHGFPARLNEILLLSHDSRGKITDSEVFITAKEPLFRPTQMMVAPDGNFYVLDWFGKDDENDLTGRLLKISYTGKISTQTGVGLDSKNHHHRKVEKERLLKAGPSSLPAVETYLKSKNPVTACEALWVLRRCNWKNRESVIKSALNHQNWRVRRLAVEILIATNLHNDSFCRKMAQDVDPEVQMEAVFGLQDPIEIGQILTEILPQGVADIQRLRYQAAIYLARHGSVLQIENLVKNQNQNIRLAGLIALDEAMYTLSNKYNNTRLKEIPDLMVKLVNTDIALKEITGIAARWPTHGIHQKISLKLINDLKKEKNQDSFTDLLSLLKSIKSHKTPEVQTLSLDWIKNFAKVSPDDLSPRQEKLLSILIEINGVSQLSDPVIKHMIKGKKLAPSLKNIGNQSNRYLVESILHPSKVVKTGYLVGDQSMMPAGLEKTMSESELVDLIAYLKTL